MRPMQTFLLVCVDSTSGEFFTQRVQRRKTGMSAFGTEINFGLHKVFLLPWGFGDHILVMTDTCQYAQLK
jgi:hypothetical protein